MTKIEECATGAVYCQVIDAIYGNVPVAKCKWGAKQQFEYVENYKILQQAFAKNDIKRYIDVSIVTQNLMQIYLLKFKFRSINS